MKLAMLNAVWNGPGPKPFPLVVPSLPANLPFQAINALGASVAINTLPYQQVTVDRSSFLWDAITVGYCSVPAMTGIPNLPSPALAKELRRAAAARANYLAAAFVLPSSSLGPKRRASYGAIEATEKVVLSFLMGQTIALRQTKVIWGPMYGVHRLYHRSLYSGIPGLPVPPGPSPDYLCDANVAGVRSLGVLEAKGRGGPFDPVSTGPARDKLNAWFKQWVGLGLTPRVAAVSIACVGSPFSVEQIVGQFWDPPFDRGVEMPEGFGDALLAEYFLRMRAFLASFGEPARRRDRRGMERQVWNCAEIGFEVSMSLEQYLALEVLAENPDQGKGTFRHFLESQKFIGDALAEPGRPTVRNADGLSLTLTDPNFYAEE